MKKHILFPTDFSPASKNAFDFVLNVAQKMTAKLTVMHVVVPEVEALDVPVMAAEATKTRVELAKEIMNSFVNKKGITKDLMIQQLVEIGLPGRAICHEAKKKNFDFICMGAQGEHNTFDRIFGSVSSIVVSHSHCPVLIVPENAKFKEISSVLYATDYQETDPFHISKAVDILTPFSEIVRCVHVKTSTQKERKPLDMHALGDFFKAHSPSIQISFHEWEAESIFKGLNEFAEIYEVNVIIMLAQKRNILERLLHKSETKSFTLDSKMPVLIMKEH